MKYQIQRSKKWLALPLFVLALGYVSYALLRPLPLLQPMPASKQLLVKTPASALSWPAQAQAAVTILDSTIQETHGSQTPVPIASTAKVLTALTVLSKKPLASGQPGPTIMLTAADVAIHDQYAAVDGSLVPVVAGEQITEYQMLQAILLPSANNIADSMAIWAFGSLDAYAAAANAFASTHGMANTHVGSDASGFSPSTTSTAHDLAILGALAMKEPVLADVVGQESATGIPQTTSVQNVNALLGTDNIIGVKTGNTDQAGGVFISASRITLNEKLVTIITAIAGSADLQNALTESRTLVESAQSNFSPLVIANRGEILGHYQQPWGGELIIVADKTLSTTAWNGSDVTGTVALQTLPKNAIKGLKVGELTAALPSGKASAHLVLATAPTQPSLVWRLTHPF